MKYTKTEPCDQCPFLDVPNMRRAFSIKRLHEFSDTGQFPCHKTAECDDETDEFVASKNSVACAGALIFCEKRNRPNQMMRIMERIGAYDLRKLNMEARVR